LEIASSPLALPPLLLAMTEAEDPSIRHILNRYNLNPHQVHLKSTSYPAHLRFYIGFTGRLHAECS